MANEAKSLDYLFLFATSGFCGEGVVFFIVMMTSIELNCPLVANRPQASYRLMLFDLSIYGHHPSYIKYLLQYWHQQERPGQLVVLVSPRFLEAHCDVVELAQRLDAENIQFHSIAASEERALKSRSTSVGRNLRNFQEWRLLCKYAKSLQVDHVLTMYYDTYQNPILLNQMPPCPVSGIYFRPKFHYRDLGTTSPQAKPTVRERWAKFLLERVLSKPKLHRLFSLDPFVMGYITPRWRDKLIYLPDPVELTESSTTASAALRDHFNIDPHRKVFLLFGALTERKGIYELLEAIPKLSPELAQQAAFIFLGESSPVHREKIDPAVERLCQLYPVQIIRHYEFVDDAEVRDFFELADGVLALYQRHVGMSGILLWAAVSQTPILGSDYGLMGEMARQYRLGVTVDAGSPEAIAEGLTALLQSPTEDICDRDQMAAFAQINSAERFADTLLSQLWPMSQPA